MMGDPAGQREVRMPTVLRVGPNRFFFWAHENQEIGERPHIHIVGRGIWWEALEDGVSVAQLFGLPADS